VTIYTHKDISHTMKASDNGVIDKVMVSTNLDGEKFVKIRTRSVRIPEMGDKLASTHGQKGTIGMIVSTRRYAFYQRRYCTGHYRQCPRDRFIRGSQ
jgi:DNA-directed RNA polymerase beta subunit